MSSIFDKLRNSFLKTKKQGGSAKSGGGNLLGSSRAQSTEERESKVYSITLNDESLGCVIPHDDLVIVSVEKGSAAYNQGIVAGDTLKSLDGNPVENLATLKMLLDALERPFELTFSRQAVQEAGSSASGKLIPDMGIMKAISSGNNPPPPLSAEEKDERREAMMKAAAERESSWSRKIKSSSAKRDPDMRKYKGDDRPVFDHSEAASVGSSNAETQRMVAAAKRGEVAMASSIGYSPYAPHSSTGFTNSAPDTSSRTISAAPVEEGEEEVDLLTFDGSFEHLNEDNYNAVDGAFEMLFASNEGEVAVLTAIRTVSKMLGNLTNEPLNMKFRQVRLANKAIQERIVTVKGAVEVLEAAGFHAEEQSGESLLVHAESAQNTDKARYVLSRLMELL